MTGPCRRSAQCLQSWRRLATVACLSFAAFGVRRSALASMDAMALLEHADSIKLSQPAEFDVLMSGIAARVGRLSADQRQYFLFLRAWKSAYAGKDTLAVAQLSRLAADSPSTTVRFRAYATLSNLFTTERRYRSAYQNLSEAQRLLPRVADERARAEGLLDAAELYSQVGQYDLALQAAQSVIDSNWAGEGVCMGGQQKLHALFGSGRFAEFDADAAPTIAACTRVGQPAYANQIRLNLAERYIGAGRLNEAQALLETHYPEVRKMGYGRQIASFEALLARVEQKKGGVAAARRFALDAVKRAIPGEYPRSLITGYRILYQLAKTRGEYAAALAYHEKYATADIGYLNDVSARQLAYQKVKQDSLARNLEIQALGRKNNLLELERKLAAKEVEATRLYLVILALVLVFIGLWAFKTKRSQLRFMSLSRLDGLTGISNRPHFIERAEAALAYAVRSGEEVSLMLFDLDHFKSINDRLGHATGDFVLKRSAELCQEYLRRSDLFGRFGGEEFIVLLPGCRLDAAREQAEQLRQAINAIRAEYRGETITVAASFGVSSSCASGYDLTRLLAHADSALYRAKRAGRNRVMAYDAAESGEMKAIPPPSGTEQPQA